MSLWKIAWRSIQQRALASSLTAVSMGLGVALVVTVLVIHQVLDQSFRRSAQGYDIIVGATKGGQLDLVLNTVYYIGQPLENIPYDYYQKFLPGGEFYSDLEKKAIPLCMGDSYEGFLVVGTIPERFTELTYLDGKTFEFSAGRNFLADEFYEAVLGSEVARKTGLTVNGSLRPTHGVAEAGEHGEKHRPFTVVGVLAPTGTPVDRGVYVNMEGFYHLEGHARPMTSPAKGDTHEPAEHAEHEEHNHEAHAAHVGPDGRLPDEAKRVTAILLCAKPARVTALAKQVNEGTEAQAALPALVIAGLLTGLVGNVQLLLLILAVVVVVVAAVGILVSIYNSMNDRRREIAIMRALGARRVTVMTVILLESILLALGGGLLGVALGHGLIGALGPTILEYAGVAVSALQFQWSELVLIPGLIGLAAVVGYLPAAVAYRTDVARSLSSP